jgi:hypothetical protein
VPREASRGAFCKSWLTQAAAAEVLCIAMQAVPGAGKFAGVAAARAAWRQSA